MASKSVMFALLVTLVCMMAGNGSCWRAWLYRDTHHRGGHIELSGDGCVNIQGDFNDVASSVNTHGGCLRLYEHGGCTGRSLELFPGSGAHNDLGAHGFNDIATSVGNCPRRKRAAEFNSFASA